MNFIENLQELNIQLFEQGKNLSDLGIDEYGWQYPQIIEVIDFGANNNYSILGGDVYSFADNKFTVTGDSWYILKSDLSTGKETDRDKAIKYLSEYNKRNGDAFIYVPVLKYKG